MKYLADGASYYSVALEWTVIYAEDGPINDNSVVTDDYVKCPDDCVQYSMNLSAYQARRRRSIDYFILFISTIGKVMTMKAYSRGSAAAVTAVLAREAATKRHGGKGKVARYFRRYESTWISMYFYTNVVYTADMSHYRIRVPGRVFSKPLADLVFSLLMCLRSFSMGSVKLSYVTRSRYLCFYSFLVL